MGERWQEREVRLAREAAAAAAAVKATPQPKAEEPPKPKGRKPFLGGKKTD